MGEDVAQNQAINSDYFANDEGTKEVQSQFIVNVQADTQSNYNGAKAAVIDNTMVAEVDEIDAQTQAEAVLSAQHDPGPLPAGSLLSAINKPLVEDEPELQMFEEHADYRANDCGRFRNRISDQRKYHVNRGRF